MLNIPTKNTKRTLYTARRVAVFFLLVSLGLSSYAQQPTVKMITDPANSNGVIVFIDWQNVPAETDVWLNSLKVTLFHTGSAGSVTVTNTSNGSWTNSSSYTEAQVDAGVGASNNPDNMAYREITLGAAFQFGNVTTAGTVDTIFKLDFSSAASTDSIKLVEGIGGSGGSALDNLFTGSGIQPALQYSSNGNGAYSSYIGGQSSSLEPLPVELLYLTADWQGEDAVVEWETASELNNSHFDVERSFDGSGFEYIGTVGSKATGGNSNARLVYTYTDLGVKARTMKNVFYRLIQTDFDGASEVFRPARLGVNRTTETSIALFPVPAQNEVTVQTIGLDEGVNYTLRVIGNLGNTVQESTFLSGRSYNKTILDISSLPSGVYRVTVEGGNLQGEVEKFIKID